MIYLLARLIYFSSPCLKLFPFSFKQLKAYSFRCLFTVQRTWRKQRKFASSSCKCYK